MKGFVLILLMIYPWLVNAQSLHYATSYDSAFIQAKEEGKMVLVYAYSPCRLCDDMTEKVLSLPDMADFLNNHFILVDMDMDERAGVLFKREHRLKQCPSFLLFNNQGKLLHKIAGICPGEELLAKISRGLDERANYAMVKQRYEAGERSIDLLPDYLFALDDAGEIVSLSDIARDFFPSFSSEDLVSKKGWIMFQMCVNDYRDAVFQAFLQNKAYFVDHVGEKQVNAKIRQVLMTAFQACLQDTSGMENPALLMVTIDSAGMPEREILRQLWTLHEKKDYAAIMDFYDQKIFMVEPIFRSELGDFLSILMKGADRAQRERISAYTIKCLKDLRARRSHIK